MFSQSKSQLVKWFLMTIVISLLCSNPSNASRYEDSKELLRLGEISEGLKGLRASAKDDPRAAHLLGLIYLDGKLLKQDKARAYNFFMAGAKQCFEKSIQTVEKLFLLKRGSKYFDPKEFLKIKRDCSGMLVTGKNNEKTEQIIDNEILESDKNIQKEEDLNPKKGSASSSVTNEYNKITNDVILSWNTISTEVDDLKLIGMGSGFSINKNGYFLTNDHVVDECSSAVVLYNDLFGKAKIIKKSKKHDLAVIKVNAPTPYFAKLSPKKPQLGEELIALGYPIGEIFGMSPTVSFGVVKNTEQSESAVRREGFLLVDLQIASGNSGGPVFNKRGALRGVVSYGVDAKDYQDELEDRGFNDFISSNTFSFIVSTSTTKKWLKANNVDFHLDYNENYVNTEEVTSNGLKSLALIGCVK